MAMVQDPETGEWVDEDAVLEPAPLDAAPPPPPPIATVQPKPVAQGRHAPRMSPVATAQAAVDDVGKQQVGNLQEDRALHVEQAQKEAANADRMQAAAAEGEKRQLALQEKTRAEVEKRRSIADADEKSLRDAKDFHVKETTEDSIRGVVGMLLGGISAALRGPGAVNRASERLDKIREGELAGQRERYARLKEQAARSSGAVNDAYGDHDRQEEWLKTVDIVARQKELAIAKSTMANTGMKQAEIEGNALILRKQQELAQAKLAGEQLREKNAALAVKRAGGGGTREKSLTGPQATAAGNLGVIASNLEEAVKLGPAAQLTKEDIAKIQRQEQGKQAADNDATGSVTGNLIISGIRDYAPKGLANRLAPRDALEGISDEKKQFYGHVTESREAILKIKTGAGMTLTEAEANKLGFMPAYDDSPAVVRSKLLKAAAFAQEHSIEAGAAAPALNQRLENIKGAIPSAVPDARSAAPAAQAKPAPDARRAKHPKYGPGWFYGGEFHPDGA